MGIEIKKMETEEEIRGKAFVHWRCWHEVYAGIVDPDYLGSLTLEVCEERALRSPENHIVAKDNGNVIGFVGYGGRGEEAPGVGELFTLYVLPEYWGKGVGRSLMAAALEQLKDYPEVCLWVLKENSRAIRFYQKCGFCPDGEEKYSQKCGAAGIRLVLY